MSVASETLGRQNAQSKVTMAFILMLALSGLEALVAEIIPTFELGPIEIGISTFFFVPLVLAILFNNWWVALAAPLGEIIFSDFVLGEFGGLSEFEELIIVPVALMVAAYIARDPRNRMQVLWAGLIGYLLIELPATMIDIAKVWIGVEEFEAVEGLPESIVAVESIDFLVEYIISGVLLGALPAMWLAPRLYGKLEPLLGMKPRSPDDPPRLTTATIVGLVIGATLLAGAVAALAASGFTIFEWEPEFLESVGTWVLWVGVAVTAIIAAVVLFVAGRNKPTQ